MAQSQTTGDQAALRERRRPLVSVCIITYNHEPYVAQAIDSVLQQRTEFPFEIIVGEDDSADGTRNIVLGYRDRHPDCISVLLHDRRNAIYVDGRATGRWNFVQTLSRAKGKYIAYLEGDDYWTDPFKLQKQVAFLESHPDYALCGHLVETVDAHGRRSQKQVCTGDQSPEILRIEHVLAGTPLHPSSWLFRNFELAQHIAYPLLLKAPAADDVLALMLLGQGKGHCIREYSSAYRLHSGGTWSAISEQQQEFLMLQFGCIAFHLVSGTNRLRLMAGIILRAIMLLKTVLVSALRARSAAPIVEFALRSARQTVIRRPILLLIYGTAAALAPIYAIYKLAVVLFRRMRRDGSEAAVS